MPTCMIFWFGITRHVQLRARLCFFTDRVRCKGGGGYGLVGGGGGGYRNLEVTNSECTRFSHTYKL